MTLNRVLPALLALSFLAAPALIRAEEKQDKPRTREFRGQIATVDKAWLTVVHKKDSGELKETFEITPETKVLLPTDQTEEVKGEGGKLRTRVKMAEGKVSDLKAGDRVTVTHTEDHTALSVSVTPPEKKRERKEKEGEDR